MEFFVGGGGGRQTHNNNIGVIDYTIFDLAPGWSRRYRA